MSKHKDIVQGFSEAFHQLETSYTKLETLRRMGQQLLSKEECIAIDEELTALNSLIARSWTSLQELQKKAVPEVVEI